MSDSVAIHGAGGSERVERVVVSQRKRWLRYVVRVVGNSTDAEDVLHDVVRRVLIGGRSFESDHEARRYLARSVSNAAMDMYEARRRERLRCVPVQDQALADHQRPGPEQFLEHLESEKFREGLLALLDKALHELPAEQYEAIRLTVLDMRGSSIRDAGAMNGIPYSTLRYRSVQGVRRLRKIIRRALRKSGAAPARE